MRDLYGYLIDGMQGTRGAIRSGGDGAPNLSGDTPTQEPLARYSGVVKVGPDGKATVTFDIPSFNGTLRVMAVAWAKGRVGSATSDVIVRDPVVLTGTLPRFLNIGDQSRFFVQIDNVEGPAGDYTLDLDVRGPVVVAADATHKTVQLEAGGKTSLTIPVTAAGMGAASFDVRLSGGGVEAVQSLRRAHSARHAGPRAPHRARPAGRRQRHRLERPRGRHLAGHRRRLGLGGRRSPPSMCRPCCRRSTATPMAAPSRR